MNAGQLMKLVVRMALERGPYESDLAKAAVATKNAAETMRQSATRAGQGMGEGMATAARGVSVASVALVGLGVVATTAYRVVSEAQAEHLELAKSIITTGNAAGVTTGQLHAMAREIGDSVGTQAKAAEALGELAETGQVAGTRLKEYGQLAVELERTLGQSIGITAQHFELLGRAPVQASLKLNESMHYLTASVYAQIKALEEQGHQTEAAGLAQQTYAAAQAQRMAGVEQNLGYVERAWRAVKEAAKAAWDRMLDIGRQQTLESRLSSAQKLLRDWESTAAGKRTTEQTAAVAQLGGESGLREQISGLQELIANQRASAQMEAERGKANEAAIAAMNAVDKVYERTLSKQARMTAALKVYHDNLEAIRKVKPDDERLLPKTVAAGESAIRKQYAERSPKGAAARDYDSQAQALANYVSGLDRAIEKTQGLTEVEKARLFLKGLGSTGEVEQVQQLVLGLAEQADKTTALAAAERERAVARQRAQDMQAKDVEAQIRVADDLERGNAALEAEIELIGLDERSRRALAEAKNQQLILDKELELQMARNIEGNEQTVAVLERELNLLNRRQELLGRRNDFADWADDSAKRAKALEDVLVNGWQRSGDALADFIVDGKNGFGDLSSSVIKDLIKMEYQAQMTSIWKSIGGFSGIWGGLTTGLANMMGGNSLDNLINLTGGWGTVAVNHGGGIAGLEAASTRSVSMTAFAGAPRFHTGGIAGDEVPIIARKGEGIFTEQQMRNLAPVDRESSRSVVVHLTNQFNGPADKAQVMTAAHLGAAMAERNIRDQLNRGRM